MSYHAPLGTLMTPATTSFSLVSPSSNFNIVMLSRLRLFFLYHSTTVTGVIACPTEEPIV